MPCTRSSAETNCISDVPGFAKHVSTPLASSVRRIASAPFMSEKKLALAELERDPLHLHHFLDRCHAAFAAEPAVLNAAERNVRLVRQCRVVDMDHARVHALRKLECFLQIVCHDCRGETVRGVVR